MEEGIKNFFAQFDFQPAIRDREKLAASYSRFVVGGMGGSHLAADLLGDLKPDLDLTIHEGFGLPDFNPKPEETLFIASSYSGETEETLDFLNSALEKNYPVLVISTGGRLLQSAKSNGLPHIELPVSPVLPPRLAAGFGFLALVAALGDAPLLGEAQSLKGLSAADWQAEGDRLALGITGTVPLIYSSDRNQSVACHFKVDLNETAKAPAFVNSFPELDHNELAGFEFGAEKFSFLILKDNEDDPRLIKRQEVFKSLLSQAKIFEVNLTGGNRLERLFGGIILAEWTGFFLARRLGREPGSPGLISEFKRRLV